MGRGDVGLVFGIAGFLLGGAAIFVAVGAKTRVESVENVQTSDNETLAALGEKLDKADKSLKDLTQRVNGIDVNPRSLVDRVKALEARLEAVESRTPLPKDAGSSLEPQAAPKKPDAASIETEIDSLWKKMREGDATADETAKLFQLLREHPEVVDGRIAELLKDVDANPRDTEKRMSLARQYLLKLLSVPDGPERGAWSMKSIEQYKAVLDVDPNHWEARYSLAFNYSAWPDFLNKTPDAIKEFETLRKIQESQTPDPKHAGTYLQLSKLYQKTGKTAEATQALEEGLRRFPDDEELKKAKDGAK
jgi:TolA-binding protein